MGYDKDISLRNLVSTVISSGSSFQTKWVVFKTPSNYVRASDNELRLIFAHGNFALGTLTPSKHNDEGHGSAMVNVYTGYFKLQQKIRTARNIAWIVTGLVSTA